MAFEEIGLNLVKGVDGGSPKSLNPTRSEVNVSTHVCPQWTDRPGLASVRQGAGAQKHLRLTDAEQDQGSPDGLRA